MSFPPQAQQCALDFCPFLLKSGCWQGGLESRFPPPDTRRCVAGCTVQSVTVTERFGQTRKSTYKDVYIKDGNNRKVLTCRLEITVTYALVTHAVPSNWSSVCHLFRTIIDRLYFLACIHYRTPLLDARKCVMLRLFRHKLITEACIFRKTDFAHQQ